LILITQRIEEAEIICDNIGLMVNGSILDYGPPGQLKQKHGRGYRLKIELYHVQDELDVDYRIKTYLPFCQSENQKSDHLDTFISYNFDEMGRYSSAEDF